MIDRYPLHDGAKQIVIRARLPAMKRLLFFALAGALIAWLADPVSGARRRESVAGMVQRGSKS